MKQQPYLRRVHYYETDQMAIVHHSNYIRWFEEARLDFLNQIGLNYRAMEEQGVIIPVTEVSCKYLISARYDDLLEITPILTQYTGVRMGFRYEVRLHGSGELAATGFDATQIPINLFDWGQIENGGLEKLRRSGMMVFVRSVYLQGLVFQDPARLDPRMEFARDTLEKFRGLCKKYSLSPAALALSYALSLPGVASLVLGSEKPEQVEQNAALLEQAVALSDAQMAEIRASFLDTPARVLNPSMWFNAC